MGMRVLLDTHAVIWWWTDDARLPKAARAVIGEATNSVLVSAASAWELATKYRIGKWPEVASIVESFETLVLRSRFGLLPITAAHALAAGMLDGPHRDPFDRMLIAQTHDQQAMLVSSDRVFRSYAVSVIWDAVENDAKA
jgi:PIN domain nuclease of toxin-antitoxin system